MAEATVLLTIGTNLNSVDTTERSLIIRGTAAIGAATDDYEAGGLVTTFNEYDSIKSSSPPTYIKIWSQTGTATANTTQYLYSYQPGTTAANGLTQIWECAGEGAPLDEYDDETAVTNPAADVLFFEAVFPRV